MSINNKSPRHRIPEAFRVERLEPRVMLSADPLLAPLSLALLPHAALLSHVPANPAAEFELGLQGTAHPLFSNATVSAHQTVLQPTQTVTPHAAQDASVATTVHATATAATSMAVATTAPSAASASVYSMAGRMHVMTAAPGSLTTWTTDQTFTTYTNSGSIALSKSPVLNVNVGTGISLGGTGDWIYGVTSTQDLNIQRTGSTAPSIDFGAALPAYAASGQYALHNLTLGTSSAPVGNVNFHDQVNLTGNLVIYTTGTVTFGGTLTLTNNASLTIVGATNVTFDGAVSLTNLDGTDASGTATVTGTAGNISIAANHIVFPTGANAFSGSGTLTLQTATAHNPIFFADPSVVFDPTALVIANADLRYWGATFSNIYIGASNGGHADSSNAGPVSIGATMNGGLGAAPTVLDNITFYGTSITVTPPVSVTTPAYTFYGAGNITFDAVNDIVLNNTVVSNGGNGAIVATSASGAITESGAATYLSGASLVATAVNGITLPSTQLGTLTATNSGAGSNSISVTQNAAGGALTVLQAAQTSVGSSGNIAISTTSGNLLVSGSGTGVATAGSGNVSLVAQGTGATLNVAAAVTAHAGSITMTAPGQVTLGALTSNATGQVNITSSLGVVQVNANVTSLGGALALNAGTDIDMTAGTLLSSVNGGNSGTITLIAGGNDVLATLAAGGSMAVTATTGSITSAMAESTSSSQLNFTGATARTTLTAATGIGARNHDIQTKVSEITLANSVSGDVFVNQTQTGALQLGTGSGAAVTLGGTTGTASIVTTDGGITVNGTVSSTATGGVAGQTGHILLQSSRVAASSADITLGAGVSSTSGSIEIQSAGSVNVGNGSAINVAANAAGQTVWLQAAASVVFVGTSQVNAGGNVWVQATGGNVALGEIFSGGIVAVDAGNVITDVQSNGSQTVANVNAASVRLASGSGIGTSANAVEVANGSGGVTFAGAATTGGIYLLSKSNLTVNAVGATPVNLVGPAATPTQTGDAGTLTSVSVYGASNLVLKSTADLTVGHDIGLAGPVTIGSTPTSTQVRLDAGGHLDIEGNIGNTGGGFTSYTGNMTLLGSAGVTLGGGFTVSTLAGTLDVESGAGSVGMVAGSLLKSSSGDIRVQGAQNVGVARVQTGGNVALTATAGSVTDATGNTTGTPGTINVTAATLRLKSGADAGATGDELQVSVGTLSASAAGSVYVIDNLAETVGSVSVAVNQVSLAGTTAVSTDAAQGGVSSGATGNIVLENTANAITLDTALNAAGSGNVLVQTDGGSATIDIEATVSSGSGHVTVAARGDVDVAQNVTTGGAGNVEITAAGNVVMTGNTLVSSGTGNVRLAAQSISLARVSTGGDASLVAVGNILDANGNTDAAGLGITNVTANHLRLNAGNAVGTSTDALQTQVANVSALGAGVYLLNDQAETIGTFGVTTTTVTASGGTSSATDASQVGVASTLNGNVVLQTTAGNLTVSSLVNANGSGNVLLQSEAGTLALNANVDSSGSSTGNGSGNISLLGATGVTGVTSVATGSGTIDVESGAAVAMAAGSVLQSTSGAIGVQAATSIAVGTVQTNVGAALTALGGAITDANGVGGAANVVAAAARLQATTGIGQAADPLRLMAANLTASAGAGGVFLTDGQSATVSHATVVVNKVAQNGAAGTTLTQALQNGVTTSGGGAIVLQTSAGDLTLSSTSTTLPAVIAAGGGNVLLKSAAGTVSVNASVYSNAGGTGAGHITVSGATGVSITQVGTNPSIATGSGSIDVESGAGITMAANALVRDGTGAVRLAASQNVALGRVTTGGNAQIVSLLGAVTDADGNLSANPGGTIDVTADGLIVDAFNGAGTTTDALRTQVNTLTSHSSHGSLFAINDQAVRVGQVQFTAQVVAADGSASPTAAVSEDSLATSTNGSVVLRATAGDIDLEGVGSDDTISAAGTGNVLVKADAGHVVADFAVESAQGNVTLQGTQGVTLNSTLRAGSTVDVESSAGSVAMGASAFAHAGADLHISAAQDIAVAFLDVVHDASLTAIAGSITDALGQVNAGTGGATNVTADGLRLAAGNAVGTGTDALHVRVNTLSESVGTGGGYVATDLGTTVGSVSASVNKTGMDGATTAVNDTAQAGLVSSGNGNLVVDAAGDLTLTSLSPTIAAVNAGGSGNVMLQSTSGVVNVDASVYSGGGTGAGNIELQGSAGVNVGAPGVVATVGSGGGTVDVESLSGDVVMSAHSVLASGGADVRVAAAGSIAVGQIESGGNVSLLAVGGSVTDANGNANGQSGNVLDVQATGLRIVAGQSAGTATDALQTQVDSVAASVGDDLFLVNDQAFAVDTVAATIQQVGVDGSATAWTDAAISGTAAGSDGHLALQASTGDVTVDQAVSSTGNAKVLVRAATGAVHVDAGVVIGGAGAGAISVIGATGVDVASNTSVVASAAGTVDVESSAGSVQMGAGSEIDAAAVRVIAAQDVGLGRVVASGNVAITATAGTIGNVTGAGNNVNASALLLSAGTAAGTSTTPLQVQVATLSAQVGSGGVSVVDAQGFATGSVSTTVSQVGLDGGLAGVTTATASDAIASAGAVTLEATAGDITLASASPSVAAINANGNGNVSVAADIGSINVNANVLDGSGNTAGGISLVAAQNVRIGSANVAVDVVDGAGVLDIEALHGDIAMSTASALQASVGTVNVVANGSVTLGQVQATGNTFVQAVLGALAVNGNVTVGAGTATGTVSLHAAQDITVAAGVTVSDGAGAMLVASALGNVRAATSSLLQSASGTVRVAAGQAVTLGQVNATGNTVLQAQGGALTLNNTVADGTGAQAGALTLLATSDIVLAAGVAVSDGAGRIDAESSTGNVVMHAGSALRSAGGTVDVVAAQGVTLGRVQSNANTLVQAQGGTVAVADTVQAGAGNLSILATGDIDVAAVTVGSGAGSLDVESGGSVAMNAAGVLSSTSGAVLVHAAQNVAVGAIATAGNVSVVATAGSITDASGGLDIAGNGVRLAAGNGAGSAAQPLEVQAGTLSASAGAGGVSVQTTQGVTVGSVGVTVNQVRADGSTVQVSDAAQAGIVTGANGSVWLRADAGDVTLTPSGGNAIAANGSGSVYVQAQAAGGNVDALAGITSGTGAIDVEAGNNIVLYTPSSGAAQLSTALPGLVTVHAVNGTVISGGNTAAGQTVNFNQDQLTLQAPLTGTNNQLDIGPATVASNPDAVVVGGPAAGGAGALYLSQQQIGLIQGGFKDVDIGSSIPGQAVVLTGQDASGQPSANVFVNPLTLTANGAGGTVTINGGLQATSLDVEGSRTGTTLASAAVATSGAITVNDNVIVSGATSLTSGTGGAADLTVNGTITGAGTGNTLALSANGGNIVVTGAVSGLGGLAVSQAASLTFQSTFAVVGNVVIDTTGTVNFNGGVTIAAGGSLTINGATQVTFAAGADFTQAGNVKIAANALNLDGGAGSFRGAGVLTLTAATASGAIHVGTGTTAGALNIGAQTVSAIAPGFQQVVLGTVDTSTGHASTGAGAVDITGSTDLTAFAAPLAVYASTVTVGAGGTGVHVGGALTLDAVGQVSLGSDVVTTVAANITLTSATSTVSQAAQTKLGSLGGNVTLATGNSSNASLSVIDTRASGSDVGAIVSIDAGHGRVIDVNADANVNVYAAAVSMKGYGLTDTAGSTQAPVLKVRAPVIYVAAPTGVVVADSGQDGRTNYNALDHGTMYEELIAVGAATRVTLPGDAVAGGGSEMLAAQGVDVSLMHAAAAETFMSRLFASSVTATSSSADGVSLSVDVSSDAGYVVGSVASQPSVSGIASYGEGSYDYWTESLEA